MVDCWAQSLPWKVSRYCVQEKICGIPKYLASICRILDRGNLKWYGAGVSAENCATQIVQIFHLRKDLQTSCIFGFSQCREFKMVWGEGIVKRQYPEANKFQAKSELSLMLALVIWSKMIQSLKVWVLLQSATEA